MSERIGHYLIVGFSILWLLCAAALMGFLTVMLCSLMWRVV